MSSTSPLWFFVTGEGFAFPHRVFYVFTVYELQNSVVNNVCVCWCPHPVKQRATEASRSPHSPWSGRTDCRRSSEETSGRNQQHRSGGSPERGRSCPPRRPRLLGASPRLRRGCEGGQVSILTAAKEAISTVVWKTNSLLIWNLKTVNYKGGHRMAIVLLQCPFRRNKRGLLDERNCKSMASVLHNNL